MRTLWDFIKDFFLFSFIFFVVFIFTGVVGSTIWPSDPPDWYMLLAVLGLPIAVAYTVVRCKHLNSATPSESDDDTCTEQKAASNDDTCPEQNADSDETDELNYDELKYYENKLNKRAAELDQREQNMDKQLKEEALKLRRQIITDSAKIRYDAEDAIENLDRYKTALLKTEARTLDWVRRREKDDIEAFNEILADVEKFSKYSQQKMTGFEFESHVAELLRGNGFTDVEVTPKSQDFGADIVGCLKGAKYVFQCKYYSSPVGIDAVQQIYSAKMHYDAHVPVVVTNSVFTKAAKILAEEVNVLLWDCKTVAEMEAKANIKPPLEPAALV